MASGAAGAQPEILGFFCFADCSRYAAAWVAHPYPGFSFNRSCQYVHNAWRWLYVCCHAYAAAYACWASLALVCGRSCIGDLHCCSGSIRARGRNFFDICCILCCLQCLILEQGRGQYDSHAADCSIDICNGRCFVYLPQH